MCRCNKICVCVCVCIYACFMCWESAFWRQCYLKRTSWISTWLLRLQIQSSYCEISNQVLGHYACGHSFVCRLLDNEAGYWHERSILLENRHYITIKYFTLIDNLTQFLNLAAFFHNFLHPSLDIQGEIPEYVRLKSLH